MKLLLNKIFFYFYFYSSFFLVNLCIFFTFSVFIEYSQNFYLDVFLLFFMFVILYVVGCAIEEYFNNIFNDILGDEIVGDEDE